MNPTMERSIIIDLTIVPGLSMAGCRNLQVHNLCGRAKASAQRRRSTAGLVAWGATMCVSPPWICIRAASAQVSIDLRRRIWHIVRSSLRVLSICPA